MKYTNLLYFAILSTVVKLWFCRPLPLAAKSSALQFCVTVDSTGVNCLFQGSTAYVVYTIDCVYAILVN